MNLQQRIELASRLGDYILSNDPAWQQAKEKAGLLNPWFTPEFIDLASDSIAKRFLKKEILQSWTDRYPQNTSSPKNIGIVMAGNIPMVGFHDFLSVFMAGHRARIKLSSKDDTLIKHLIEKMVAWENEVIDQVSFEEMLKNCDAYIATGSNHSSRYFEQYFGKYPHIIRRNRTSAAILDGTENAEELDKLADDVHRYFGMGCRNVTKIFVPENYDFVPLLAALKKYSYLADHHKYKNNYDYNLALHILNNKFYMTNGSVILLEHESLFAPISQLHYEFYTDKKSMEKNLKTDPGLQCIIGHEHIPFGGAQDPAVDDYADGVDTMQFLTQL